VPHAFKVVNPQKSFTICAPSAKAKLAWIEAIHLALKAVRAQRKKYMQGSNGDDATSSGNSNGNVEKKTPTKAGGTPEPKVSPDPKNPLAYVLPLHSSSCMP
jgi:hypothetical protein